MKHIVHIDISEFFRKLMKSYLSEKGLDSESFSHGKDAIDAVNANHASCIITGMELEDMSGEDLIKQLTNSGHNIPIIVVTSREEDAGTRLVGLNVKAIICKSSDWQKELDKIFV